MRVFKDVNILFSRFSIDSIMLEIDLTKKYIHSKSEQILELAVDKNVSLFENAEVIIDSDFHGVDFVKGEEIVVTKVEEESYFVKRSDCLLNVELERFKPKFWNWLTFSYVEGEEIFKLNPGIYTFKERPDMIPMYLRYQKPINMIVYRG